ncbi:MAG: GNAT family N-acetyltransferase [Deltaproteobacteria bacterium]
MTPEYEKTEAVTISLRYADGSDMADLLEWRNHPDTRKSSFNTDAITPEAHEAWFKKKLASTDTVIYIAISGTDKLGTIRFEDNGETIKTSVMLNPSFFGQGLGAKVVAIGTEKYLREKSPANPIIAEIKTDNTASLKAFAKAGFKESFVTLIYEDKGKKNVT